MARGHSLENGRGIESADVFQEHAGADGTGPLLLVSAPILGIEPRNAVLGPPRAFILLEVNPPGFHLFFVGGCRARRA